MFVATVILLNVAGLEVTAKREANLANSPQPGSRISWRRRSAATSSACRCRDRHRIRSLAVFDSSVAASSAAMLGVRPDFATCRNALADCCSVLGLIFLPLAGRLVAAAVAHRVSLAHRHHADDHQLGLRGWHPGRDHQLRDLRVERQPGERGQFSFDGSNTAARSTAVRASSSCSRNTAGIAGMSLQSYLFFGSANQLHQHIKELLAARPDCRHLLFDFRLVTGVDSSATHSFEQIKQIVDKSGVQLVLVNLSPAMIGAFRAIGFLTKDIVIGSDLDRALESCEDAIIAAHRTDAGGARSLRDWLAGELDTPEYADALAQQCRRIEFAPGDTIARQGDQSDCMHFILEGRVGVIVDVGGGRRIRVRSLGQHTTIGEMGLITRSRAAPPSKPRSRACFTNSAPMLTSASRSTIRREPGPALTYVVRVMAER